MSAPSSDTEHKSASSRIQVTEVPVGLASERRAEGDGADADGSGGSISSDTAALAALGYKQEFKRAFTPFETLSLSFTTIGLFPSVAYVSHLL